MFRWIADGMVRVGISFPELDASAWVAFGISRFSPKSPSLGMICKWLGLATAGAVGATAGWLAFIKYVYLPYLIPQSIRFMGQRSNFDRENDKELQCNFASFMPRLLQYLFLAGVKDDFPVEALQAMDQESLVGPAAACAQYHKRGDLAKENYYRHRANELLETHEEKNVKVKELITAAGREPEYNCRTIKDGCAWVLEASAEANHTEAEMASTTLIVKLSYSGELVLIGPIMGLPQNMVDRINELGPIKYIVTQAMFHTGHTTFAAQKWPDAVLIGADSKMKHGDATLPWLRFTDQMDVDEDGISKELFGEELYFLRCDGHIFREPIFFHKSSGTIFSTDLMIRGMNGSNLYSAALGLFRGEKSAKAVLPQNHHTFWLTDPPLYAKRVKKVVEMGQKEGQILVLGHGGIYRGEECAEQIENGLGFMNDPSLGWIYRSKLFHFMFNLPSYILGMNMGIVIFKLAAQQVLGKVLPFVQPPDEVLQCSCSKKCKVPRQANGEVESIGQWTK